MTSFARLSTSYIAHQQRRYHHHPFTSFSRYCELAKFDNNTHPWRHIQYQTTANDGSEMSVVLSERSSVDSIMVVVIGKGRREPTTKQEEK